MLIGGFDAGQTHTRCRLLRVEPEDDEGRGWCLSGERWGGAGDLKRVQQKHVLDPIGDGNGLAVRTRDKTKV